DWVGYFIILANGLQAGNGDTAITRNLKRRVIFYAFPVAKIRFRSRKAYTNTARSSVNYMSPFIII
ncbi:hypothetical protein C1T15_27145, partial [Escherichia coli]